jgi:hypothetical protein
MMISAFPMFGKKLFYAGKGMRASVMFFFRTRRQGEESDDTPYLMRINGANCFQKIESRFIEILLSQFLC